MPPALHPLLSAVPGPRLARLIDQAQTARIRSLRGRVPAWSALQQAAASGFDDPTMAVLDREYPTPAWCSDNHATGAPPCTSVWAGPWAAAVGLALVGDPLAVAGLPRLLGALAAAPQRPAVTFSGAAARRCESPQALIAMAVATQVRRDLGTFPNGVGHPLLGPNGAVPWCPAGARGVPTGLEEPTEALGWLLEEGTTAGADNLDELAVGIEAWYMGGAHATLAQVDRFWQRIASSDVTAQSPDLAHTFRGLVQALRARALGRAWTPAASSASTRL